MLDQFSNLMSLFVGFLGFLVVIFIAMSYKWSALFNMYLLVVFLLISFRLTHFGLSGFYNLTAFNKYSYLLGPLYLVAIPSIYLYFESLFSDRIYLNRKRIIHLLFPVANLLLNVLQHNFLIFNSNFIDVIQTALVLLFIMSYCFAVVYLSYKKLWSKNNDSPALSEIHNALMKKWALFLLAVLIILSFRLVYAIYSEAQEHVKIFGFQSSIIKSVLWLLVFVTILRTPELLYGYPKLQNRLPEPSVNPIAVSAIWSESASEIKNSQDSKLNESIAAKVDIYLTNIKNFVALQFPFRSNNYAIKDLSKDLNIPISHLSYLFKYHCEMSFVEFKNHNRIQDAVNFIDKDFLEAQTFEALAEQVGFSSYNAFFVSFKKETGLSPKDFHLNRGF